MSLHQKIATALESRILHGLSMEWEIALWNLASPYRSRLKKPLFRLLDTACLGTWFPDKKEISLGRQFVFNHPWAAVREVLHHETAHQIADELFAGKLETAHGPSFQKACHCLRIDPAASAQYPPLSDADPSGKIAPEDKIILRIQKLLALAQSQNINEAEAAMLKAHKLITKYHVDLLLLEKNRNYVTKLVTQPALRHSRDKYQLAALLQNNYFVHGIWVPVYVVEKGKTGRALEISGTAQDVALADYVYHFVLNIIDRRWAEYPRNGRRGRRRKADFAVGVVEGLRDKLEGHKARLVEQESVYAILATEDRDLVNYIAFKYPRTSRVAHKAVSINQKVFSEGKKIGRDLVISKGITQPHQGQTHRLTR